MRRTDAEDVKILKHVARRGELPGDAEHQEFYWDMDWIDYCPEDNNLLIVTEAGYEHLDRCERRLRESEA